MTDAKQDITGARRELRILTHDSTNQEPIKNSNQVSDSCPSPH